MDFFATRLVSGRDNASEIMRWWPCHARQLDRGIAIGFETKQKEFDKLRNEMLAGAVEWEKRTMPKKLGFMVEHVGLELSMMMSMIQGNEDQATRNRKFLYENAAEQAKFFAGNIGQFPEKYFRGLMEEHVGWVAESIAARMRKDFSAILGCREGHRKIVLSLAALTAEWI